MDCLDEYEKTHCYIYKNIPNIMFSLYRTEQIYGRGIRQEVLFTSSNYLEYINKVFQYFDENSPEITLDDVVSYDGFKVSFGDYLYNSKHEPVAVLVANDGTYEAYFLDGKTSFNVYGDTIEEVMDNAYLTISVNDDLQEYVESEAFLNMTKPDNPCLSIGLSDHKMWFDVKNIDPRLKHLFDKYKINEHKFVI